MVEMYGALGQAFHVMHFYSFLAGLIGLVWILPIGVLGAVDEKPASSHLKQSKTGATVFKSASKVSIKGTSKTRREGAFIKPVSTTRRTKNAKSLKFSKAPVKASSGKKVTMGKPPVKVRIPATSFEVNSSKPSMMPQPLEDERSIKAMPAFTNFDLPTDNQMIFSCKHAKAFFQPTFSGRTISAMFGCVRNPGCGGGYTRFHEGVDIRPLERNDDGEPMDEVRSAGDGRVVYACRDAEGSNYGKYVVVIHDLFDPPFYTLYAHLNSIEDEIEPGVNVIKGTKLGILGRTSSEYEIDRDLAHLHFEVDLMLNDGYVKWSQNRGEGIPKHGLYNGGNLIGINPVSFLQFLQYNPDLGVGDFIRREKEAFRVLIPSQKDLSWVRRYPCTLTQPMTSTTCAYEVAMTYYGLPIRVTPRSRSKISGAAWKVLSKGRFPLIYVNSKEMRDHACSKLLELREGRWRLSERGRELLNQFVF